LHAHRTADAIVRHWQRVIESDVEAGAVTMLHAGGAHFLPSAAALYALQELAEQRAASADMSQPLVAAGGSGAFWPAALFAPQPQHTQPAVFPPTVLFGGDDPGTGMALMATWIDGLPPSPYVRHPQIHHLFDPVFMPHRHPGGATTWDMLPFHPHPSATPGDPLDLSPPADAPAPIDSATWIAWAVLVFTLLLPLLAMLI
jgi:hypothetical protein